MSELRKMNAFQIKIIMVFLMLLDHLRYIDNFVPSGIASFFTIISRCVAPMFAYFAVQGIIYTNSLIKYCVRLLALAGIVLCGNILLKPLMWTHNNNVIFTLAVGVLAIASIQWGNNKRKIARLCLYGFSALCFVVGFFWGEWGSVLLPFMYIEYYCRNKKIIRICGYILIEVIAILLSYSEPLWFLVFPFILLYNGERGPKTNFCKYFFYLFYPIHLWIIAIINYIVTS